MALLKSSWMELNVLRLAFRYTTDVFRPRGMKRNWALKITLQRKYPDVSNEFTRSQLLSLK